nr:MAG TPA: hypothetical protein [Bacteriophage sp.]
MINLQEKHTQHTITIIDMKTSIITNLVICIVLFST